LKFAKKSTVTAEIPTTSMPDLVFLLIIFFMVSSVFKEFRGIPVRLPAAKQIEKLQGKRNVAYIYANERELISIDDRFVDLKEISKLLYAKCTDPLVPLRVVSLRIDERANMSFVSKIQEELRVAGGAALNLNYSTKTASQ
jgi:biopolymer transport protein ExbD